MYKEFYGLRALPFELTANAQCLFLTSRQREALSILQYGLLASKSLTLLVGEAGTGKTTLIRAALESDRCRDVHCVYLNNPMLSAGDFVRLLAQRFELGPEAAASKAVLLDRLEARLRERRAAGETTALVVDEAQSLSTELLEEIRLLANIETPAVKLLPLVLAGQPELAERLELPELRQLKQRVALRCELMPFELGDTASYIARRITAAGGVPASMFTQEAIILIHERSLGIPRTINVICDNALVNGMALGHKRVERAMIVETCRDLRLTSAPLEASVTPIVPPPVPPAASSSPELSDGETGAAAAQETSSGSSRFGFRFRWRTSSALSPSARMFTE
jgi:type II secretory pathway predicted ATPase ExeA